MKNHPSAPAALLLLALGLSPATAAGPPALPTEVFAPSRPTRRLPDDVFSPRGNDEVVDLLLFGVGRAAVVRVRVRVEGRGYRSAWSDFAGRLHAYLDRDGDGILTVAEFNRSTWTQLLSNPFNGNPAFRAGSKPGPADANPADGVVSLDELAAYLRGNQNFDALASQAGPPPDVRSESVFGHLDRDGDKTLDAGELTETVASVGRFDRDEDEMVVLDELTPDRSPFADRFRPQNQNGSALDPATSTAVALTDDAERVRASERLLKAYGKGGTDPKTRRIGPEAVGADTFSLRAADSDGDGALSASELARYLANPSPNLDLTVTIPRSGQGAPRVETTAGRGKSAHALSTRAADDAPSQPSGARVRPTSPGKANGGDALVILFEGAEIEVRARDAIPPRNNFLLDQFKSIDADKNGAVDAKEARGNFFLNRIFLVADRNGDGKMTVPELEAYNDRSQDAATCRTMLTVADRGGESVFERLDADRDGRLSVRELRQACDRLKELDRDGDGRIKLAELPRRSQIVLGRGDNPNANAVVVEPRTAGRPNGAAGSTPLPAWFAGMDRNRDGDVSPREFLGAPEHFRIFDIDGDGLIDAREASRAP